MPPCPRPLDRNSHGRPCLKEADYRIHLCWRLRRIEAEVVLRAETDRIGILVLRKSFRAPCDRACVLDNIPWRAAVSGTVRAIICPARMLNRRVKPDVADVYTASYRHADRLDGAIEVLVIKRVFIVPDAGTGFVTLKPMNQMPSLPGSGSI